MIVRRYGVNGIRAGSRWSQCPRTLLVQRFQTQRREHASMSDNFGEAIAGQDVDSSLKLYDTEPITPLRIRHIRKKSRPFPGERTNKVNLAVNGKMYRFDVTALRDACT